jgi:prepilin-type N-terminal cleavage/methylation domain-containing protein
MPLVSDSHLTQQARLAARRVTSGAGFTLVEVMVAISVTLVALIGSAAAFNLITSSIKKTEGLTAANAAIDDDVARIKSLALDYTSCVEPTGSVPPDPGPCDVPRGQSKYYFPKDPSAVEQNKFLAACLAKDPASHITANFIDAIQDLPELRSGAVRKKPTRENGSDPSSHTVIIEYEVNGKTVRSIKTSPVVSAWCG